MNLPFRVATLQKIDRWVGSPLAFVLTLFRKACGRSAAPGKFRNILFVKLAEQGSTVLAYPAICKALNQVGRENVYFVVFKENRFILDLMGVIPEGNVIAISTTNPVVMVADAMRAVLRTRKISMDAAIDLEFFARSSAILTYLSGAKLRVGFHAFFGESAYRGDLMTHRLLFNPHLHASQMFEVMVEALQCDPATLPTFDFKPSADQPSPVFVPQSCELEEVDRLLRTEDPRIASGRLVLLNSNASDLLPLRRWAPGNYVELAHRLLEQYSDVFVGLTGAPEEAGATARLAQEIGSDRCVSLAGKVTLRQLFVLYCRSELLVTNDSGPAHFASMTPIHVITLFGPETPALFAARTPRNTAIWAGIACSPCVSAQNNRRSPCRRNVCMERITVEEVFKEASHALDSRRRRSGSADKPAPEQQRRTIDHG